MWFYHLQVNYYYFGEWLPKFFPLVTVYIFNYLTYIVYIALVFYSYHKHFLMLSEIFHVCVVFYPSGYSSIVPLLLGFFENDFSLFSISLYMAIERYCLFGSLLKKVVLLSQTLWTNLTFHMYCWQNYILLKFLENILYLKCFILNTFFWTVFLL